MEVHQFDDALHHHAGLRLVLAPGKLWEKLFAEFAEADKVPLPLSSESPHSCTHLTFQLAYLWTTLMLGWPIEGLAAV